MQKLLPVILLTLAIGVFDDARAQDAPELSSSSYPRGSEAIPVLREVWELSRQLIHPSDLAQRFSVSKLTELEDLLRSDSKLPLADVLNPFLDSLEVSHTQFYDRRHQSYYLLRSLFSTQDLDSPTLYTIGVQLDEQDSGLVRAVMEGSPAKAAGIQRGDRLVSVGGVEFDSLLQWQDAMPIELRLSRQGEILDVTLVPILQSFHRALVRATLASERVIACGEQRFAYLHLWSGTHPQFLEALKDSVATARAESLDGFILDLRDGAGGAWWPYLDLFFADRSEFFAFSSHGAEGMSEAVRADPQTNQDAWLGPLAVIINSGTRSGKESLAFQFKKGGRATLFGTSTAGAFTAGRGVFADRDEDYLLYLSVQELLLDGSVIEGVGVSPDVWVEDKPQDDLPLMAALHQLMPSSGQEQHCSDH